MIARLKRFFHRPEPTHPDALPPLPSPFVMRMRIARREGLAEKQASQRAVRRIEGLRDRVVVPDIPQQGGR